MTGIYEIYAYAGLLLVYSQAVTTSIFFSWISTITAPHIKRRGAYLDTMLLVMSRMSWLNTGALAFLFTFLAYLAVVRGLGGQPGTIEAFTSLIRVLVFLTLGIVLWALPFVTWLVTNSMAGDQRKDGKTDREVRMERKP